MDMDILYRSIQSIHSLRIVRLLFLLQAALELKEARARYWRAAFWAPERRQPLHRLVREPATTERQGGRADRGRARAA